MGDESRKQLGGYVELCGASEAANGKHDFDAISKTHLLVAK